MNSNNPVNLVMENKTIKELLKFINKYKIHILGSVALIFILFVGFLTYSFYKKSQSQAAHRDLIECMKYYDAPVVLSTDQNAKKNYEFSFNTEQEKWIKVEEVFNKAYYSNSSSSISGIFLTFVSEAMLRLGKTKESLDTLSEALSKIPSKTVRDFYDVKYALMLLDSNNESNRDLGLSKLKTYSQDFDNAVNDEVLYNLGYYYWNLKNFNESKNYWNQLVHKYGRGTKDPSPWVELAKEKLKLITGK